MRRLVLCLALVSLACDGSTTAPSGPLFTRSGVGPSVFDLPSHIDRVQIQASYTGTCENFVVWVGSGLIVNTILGTCSIASGTRFFGTHATEGSQVRVEHAIGITWSITEVRQ